MDAQYAVERIVAFGLAFLTLFPVAASSAEPRFEFEGRITPPAEFSLLEDLRALPSVLYRDLIGIPSWENARVLALGAGLAGASVGQWDRSIRENSARQPDTLGGASPVIDFLGDGIVVGGVTGLAYAVGLMTENPELHRVSSRLLRAEAIAGVTSLTLKRAFNTRRPNGSQYGFPSGHTTLAFSVASVLQSEYGWVVGVPAYSVASLVGFQRIDSRSHDLSDVAFGAALGIAIGQTVGRDGLIGPLALVPLSTRGARGMAIEWRF